MCFLWNDHGEAELHGHRAIYQKHSGSRDELCVVDMREASTSAAVPKRGVWIINHAALLPQQNMKTPAQHWLTGEKKAELVQPLCLRNLKTHTCFGKSTMKFQTCFTSLGVAVSSADKDINDWHREEKQQRPHSRKETTADERMSFLSRAADAFWLLGCIHTYTTSKQNYIQIFRIVRTVYIIKRKKG